jgi:hypothetical protein
MAKATIQNTFTIRGILATTVNDTFIQTVITTGLTGQDNSAFRISEIQLEHPLLSANGSYSEMQLTRGTKAAMANFSDNSLLFKDKRGVVFVTSGMSEQQLIADYVPQGDIVVVEQQIYLGFKTTAFGALATIGYSITLEPVTVTPDERITILSQRLP